MKTTFITLLLISFSLSIKIKFRTPRNPSTSPTSPAPGSWSVKRGCRRAAPKVSMGSLFSIYAQQLYNIFNDPINELLLVRHEAQVVAGTNRRFIFRVRDKQTNDMLYIGMSIFVDLQGGVRVTGYLESFDINSIVNVLGFSGSKQYRYRCGAMNDDATAGFEEWANTLAQGGGFNQGGNFDNFDNFDTNNQSGQTGNNYPNNSYPQNNQNTHVPQQPTYVPQQQTHVPQQQTHDPFGGNDSPFEEKTININIEGTRPDGSKFLIGSARPKTN